MLKPQPVHEQFVFPAVCVSKEVYSFVGVESDDSN